MEQSDSSNLTIAVECGQGPFFGLKFEASPLGVSSFGMVKILSWLQTWSTLSALRVSMKSGILTQLARRIPTLLFEGTRDRRSNNPFIGVFGIAEQGLEECILPVDVT